MSTECHREIAGRGWYVHTDGLGREPANDESAGRPSIHVSYLKNPADRSRLRKAAPDRPRWALITGRSPPRSQRLSIDPGRHPSDEPLLVPGMSRRRLHPLQQSTSFVNWLRVAGRCHLTSPRQFPHCCQGPTGIVNRCRCSEQNTGPENQEHVFGITTVDRACGFSKTVRTSPEPAGGPGH